MWRCDRQRQPRDGEQNIFATYIQHTPLYILSRDEMPVPVPVCVCEGTAGDGGGEPKMYPRLYSKSMCELVLLGSSQQTKLEGVRCVGKEHTHHIR